MSDPVMGFTGTRDEWTKPQEVALRELFQRFWDEGVRWQHNGDDMGSDKRAGLMWQEMGGQLYGHPPENPKRRAFLQFDLEDVPKPYLARNDDIVTCSTFLVATPRELQMRYRGGTWYTIRRALGKKPIFIVNIRGLVERR
jgi:hypothetical protein